MNKLNSFQLISFLGFLVVYTIISIVCFPIPLVGLAGGAVFGPIWGFGLNLIGSSLAATSGFYISRVLRPGSYQISKNLRVQKIIKQTEKMGWKSVALLRLTPIPFHFVNYSLGLSAIKFKQYILTSTIFLIPKTIILTLSGYYGNNIIQHLNYKDMEQLFKSWF